MDYKLEYTLVSDDGVKFSTGDYIEFRAYDPKTNSIHTYKGCIVNVNKSSFLLSNVSIDGEEVNGSQLIYYIHIEPHSCEYGWESVT